MKLELAQSAGFCYGVRRAVELAEQTAGDGEPCVMLGSIIHNQDVIGRLEERGLRVVQRPDEVPAGCRVIIRSHGESRAVYEALQARNARILDATCPNVKRIHEIVSRAEEQGRQVVIVGTPDHPEVTAIAGWCRNAAVLRTLAGEEKMQALRSSTNRDADAKVLFEQLKKDSAYAFEDMTPPPPPYSAGTGTTVLMANNAAMRSAMGLPAEKK